MIRNIAADIIAGLRSQPAMLALVVVNLCFLIAISAATVRKDALLADLVQHCVVQK
jgi:hypothetical protein